MPGRATGPPEPLIIPAMPDWAAGPPKPLIPEMPDRATGPPEPFIIYARVVPRGQARTPTAAHSISGPRNALYYTPA